MLSTILCQFFKKFFKYFYKDIYAKHFYIVNEQKPKCKTYYGLEN